MLSIYKVDLNVALVSPCMYTSNRNKDVLGIVDIDRSKSGSSGSTFSDILGILIHSMYVFVYLYVSSAYVDHSTWALPTYEDISSSRAINAAW